MKTRFAMCLAIMLSVPGLALADGWTSASGTLPAYPQRAWRGRYYYPRRYGHRYYGAWRYAPQRYGYRWYATPPVFLDDDDYRDYVRDQRKARRKWERRLRKQRRKARRRWRDWYDD